MSIGYDALNRLRTLETEADLLGFRLAHSKYHHHGDPDEFGLFPVGESLPIYGRDAELWTGDLESCLIFLRGIKWDREYLKMHRLISDEKIARKEQDVRNKQLVQRLKDEPVGVLKT